MGVLGLDERLVAWSNGASVWVVLAVAVLLGLRHATDPDHLAAVTTVVAGEQERASRRAGQLGLAWGLGHAATLFGFGLPIILIGGVLPRWLQHAVETAIGLVIIALALRLLARSRLGELRFHAHAHVHGARTRRGAFAIGLVHGVGGSTGVSVLVLASVHSTGLAVVSLALLAIFTAVSMSVMSRAFGSILAARRAGASAAAVAPFIGGASLLFGFWYAAAAWNVAPYPF
jgi:high-affinity nickel permease